MKTEEVILEKLENNIKLFGKYLIAEYEIATFDQNQGYHVLAETKLADILSTFTFLFD